jgi:hypothetical protein
MKPLNELIIEIEREQKELEEKAFEAFCKEEIAHLLQIIERKRKDLKASEDRLESYSDGIWLEEAFNNRNIEMQGTNKEYWMKKLSDR